jgi:hypothetical protein
MVGHDESFPAIDRELFGLRAVLSTAYVLIDWLESARKLTRWV